MSDIIDYDTLAAIPGKYATPDPAIVSKLPKGGRDLDYVGHGDITLMLIEVDPGWTWEPLAYDEDGMPFIRKAGRLLELWGRLTVGGKTIICVGTCSEAKEEAAKELIGDLLRNGAMRFGFATKLWSKAGGLPGSESADATYEPRRTSAPKAPAAPQVISDGNAKRILEDADKKGLSDDQLAEIIKAGTGGRSDDPREIRMTEFPTILKAINAIR